MNKKLALGIIVALIIGVLIGYGIGYSAVSGVEKRVSDLQKQVTTLQNQLAERDSIIQGLQKQISDKEREIAELKKLIPPLRKGAWNVITTFKGADGFKTDYFYVAETEVRINWTWTSASEFPGFSFYLYREGRTTSTESQLIMKDTTGTTYVHNVQKANYYLNIVVANIDQWTITVEVWVPA